MYTDLYTDNTTFITPAGIGFTLLMGVLLVFLPRRHALFPIIVLTCFMTMGQRILVFDLDFTMIRILALFGWARLILRGEIRSFNKWNSIDSALVWWTVSSVVTYTLLWGTTGAFINRCGQAFNTLGMYFLFRFLVRDWDDILRVIEITAFLVIPLAVSMVLEKTTGRNSFAIFGGVPSITFVRDGVLRCQGPFSHPILAGTFGATLMPVFVGLWWQRKNRFIVALAIVSTAIITLTAGSSGPVGAYLAGIAGLVMWRFRKHMRKIRWGIVLALLGLEMVMKAHVWYLIARVGVFSGSTGWHRGYLINAAIYNFWDWWLVGTKSTEKWGRGLWDVTNQFIAEGARGGLITLLLFILIITRCFRGIGLAVRAEVDSPQVRLGVWALGVALLAHVTSYISVSYWDQNYVNWYLLLAFISTVTGPVLLAQESMQTSPVPRQQTRPLTSLQRRASKTQGVALQWWRRDSLANSSACSPAFGERPEARISGES